MGGAWYGHGVGEMTPEPEQDVAVEFAIRIPGFGTPDKVRADFLKSVSRVIYHRVSDDFVINDGEHDWRFDPHGAADGNEALIKVSQP